MPVGQRLVDEAPRRQLGNGGKRVKERPCVRNAAAECSAVFPCVHIEHLKAELVLERLVNLYDINQAGVKLNGQFSHTFNIGSPGDLVL